MGLWGLGRDVSGLIWGALGGFGFRGGKGVTVGVLGFSGYFAAACSGAALWGLGHCRAYGV